MVSPAGTSRGVDAAMRTQLHQIVAQMAARRPEAPALTIKRHDRQLSAALG